MGIKNLGPFFGPTFMSIEYWPPDSQILRTLIRSSSRHLLGSQMPRIIVFAPRFREDGMGPSPSLSLLFFVEFADGRDKGPFTVSLLRREITKDAFHRNREREREREKERAFQFPHPPAAKYWWALPVAWVRLETIPQISIPNPTPIPEYLRLLQDPC